LFLLYARTFPVIAQAEVKSILKSSGNNYKRERDNPSAVKQEKKQSKKEVKKSKPSIGADQEAKTNTLLESLGTFDIKTQQPDDLKKVKGIGPVMEKTLNQIGIYSFNQVSKMTKNEYDLLDSITGSFPGRAQRDDWAGQANKLKS